MAVVVGSDVLAEVTVGSAVEANVLTCVVVVELTHSGSPSDRRIIGPYASRATIPPPAEMVVKDEVVSILVDELSVTVENFQ